MEITINTNLIKFTQTIEVFKGLALDCKAGRKIKKNSKRILCNTLQLR